ncbi:hypothetical protein JCM3770_006025 [Rhodotorula araucariae]
MRVHLNVPNLTVIVEDVGFYLEFRPRAGEVGTVEVVAYPPGSTSKPTLDPEEHCVEAFGCLGLLQLGGKTFLLVLVPPVDSIGMYDQEVERVEEVLFYCVTDPHLLPTAHDRSHPCHHLRNVLTDGSFMYSKTFDLTSRLHTRIKVQQQRDAACTPSARDDTTIPPVPEHHRGTLEYTWNAYLLAPFNILRTYLDPAARAAFDSRSFMLPVVEGFYGAKKVQIGGEKALLSIISRRGWGRAGTRFKKRGIDGDGSVGNFAETETLLETTKQIVSFVQLRGSVPLYWQEKVHLAGPVTLTISQPLTDVSLDPFLRHMGWLVDSYTAIRALSFLSDSPDGSLAAEAALGEAYGTLCDLGRAQSKPLYSGLSFERYSIHKAELLSGGVAGMPEEIAKHVAATLDGFGATTATFEDGSGKYILQTAQQGAFRVNCRDCLDRSNLGEFSISAAALDKQLTKLGLPPLAGSELGQAHRELFSANGDALSTIYAGSRAMNSSFIRTGRVSRLQDLENAETSELRKVQALLRDGTKNRATELLTGQYKRQEWAPKLVLVSPTPYESPSPVSETQTDGETDEDDG